MVSQARRWWSEASQSGVDSEASRLAAAERDASSHVTHTQRCGPGAPLRVFLRSPRGAEPRRSLSSRTCTEPPTARYSGRCSRLDTFCQVGSPTVLASAVLINTLLDIIQNPGRSQSTARVDPYICELTPTPSLLREHGQNRIDDASCSARGSNLITGPHGHAYLAHKERRRCSALEAYKRI